MAVPGGRTPARDSIGLDERGFTLVELLIALAVAVVLITAAVPSYRQLTISNRLTTAANDVIASINSARMEAIKRNTSTQFCSGNASVNATDTLGTACGTSAGAVYSMVGADVTQVRAAVADLTSPLQWKGDLKALRFHGQGQGYAVGESSPYTGVVADICTALLDADNHRIIWMTAGSAITTTTKSGSCSS